ncbi:MAG: DUF4340 domain-containing protein [Candidatus Binatia bacterium]
MTWRRIATYYALALVLGGYFFLFERSSGKQRSVTTTGVAEERRFLPIKREDIREMTLRRTNGTVTFRWEDQGWKVIEPAGVQVPAALATSFIENLTPVKEVQVMDAAPKDLAPYGLDHPDTTVVLKGEGGKPLATVFLGSYNPTSSAVYARKDNAPQVVLLGSSAKYYEELIFGQTGVGK